jgi:hypothetical protein
MRALVLAVSIALTATAAAAQEPVGCDKFKWPLDREKALLAAPVSVASGAEAAQPLGVAIKLALVPFADAKLPMEPTRTPRSADSYAGYLRVPALPKAGTYRIPLSGGGWVDVFQGGRDVKSSAFSGATGCGGVRKSVKFELSAAPFIIEVTGTTARDIGIVVTPD